MHAPALRAALLAALRRSGGSGATAAASGAPASASVGVVRAPAISAAAAQSAPPGGAARAYATAAAYPGRPARAPHDDRAARWRVMVEKGHAVNPCNSPLHPAVAEAGILPDTSAPERCLQEAYTPESTCWGCGPAATDGLRLRSRRVENGLEARVRLDPKYESFPGIVNGGVVATLVDCLANWTAATHLMDTSAL
jgi:hypothetical protein